ncbi:MAG TPA: acyl-CoA thioesterase [Peptococcaceae bacterium]|nr:acyl-CoA thioesterase [Peptococcaceae bacterium]
MKKYEHKTQYYETDQMGIIHHSNYIRWFEEARIDMLEQLELGYAEMEASGIMIPVLGVSCEYKKMTRFGETVEISAKLTSFTGLRLTIEYEVLEKQSGELRCVGETRHCFVYQEGKPLNLKKKFPNIYDLLLDAL